MAQALGWTTNDPEAARKLRAADRAYDKAMAKAKASGLPLAAKLAAFNQARSDREMAYAAALATPIE